MGGGGDGAIATSTSTLVTISGAEVAVTPSSELVVDASGMAVVSALAAAALDVESSVSTNTPMFTDAGVTVTLILLTSRPVIRATLSLISSIFSGVKSSTEPATAMFIRVRYRRTIVAPGARGEFGGGGHSCCLLSHAYRLLALCSK